jgi:SAM-dependent methyltransferase
METLETVDREARERLHPSLTNPSWLVLRKRREIFQAWLPLVQGSRLDILDVGGRIQPYRLLLGGRVRRYVALDRVQSPRVNVVAKGEQIPLGSEQFDLVICTQVLEYIAEPGVVIEEIRRVLKPGGYLVLSVPAVFPHDCGGDTWRFLPQGVRLLLRSFSEVDLVAEGSSISGFFRTICICAMLLARPRFVGTLLQFTLVPVLNLTAAALELLVQTDNHQFAANFSALAKK